MLTGFIITIPPTGPIAFTIISKGFKNEIGEGRAIALGSAFMDFFYCLVAFTGIALMISVFPSSVADFYAENEQVIKIGLTFAGCAIVVISGLKMMKRKVTYDKLEAEKCAKLDSAFTEAEKLREKAENAAKHLKIREAKKSKFIGLFFMGMFLCLSSVTVLASWIAIIGFLKGYGFLNSSFPGGIFFALGASIGTWTWSYTLLKLITGSKKRINEATVNVLNIIAGAILLALGVLLFVKAAVAVLSII